MRKIILLCFLAFSLGFLFREYYREPAPIDIAGAINTGAAKAPRTAGEEQVIAAYKKVNKSVVNVNTRMDVVSFFGLSHREGSGSGVIIDGKQGLIITNDHVIGSASEVMVSIDSADSYPVKLIGRDPGLDLALLQFVEVPKDLIAAPLGDSQPLDVGQRVLAIGNPFGLDRTLTQGIVSSLGRSIRASDGRMIEDVIQIDAAINPGNSGGPLLDTAGRIVGLNTAILSKSGDNAGIGFAIPVKKVKEAIPQLVKYGRVLRPKLGIGVENSRYGPAIVYVEDHSPAYKAGLRGPKSMIRRGVVNVSEIWFIEKVNDEEVKSREDVINEIGKTPSGDNVKLRMRMGRSKPKDVSIKPVFD